MGRLRKSFIEMAEQSRDAIPRFGRTDAQFRVHLKAVAAGRIDYAHRRTNFCDDCEFECTTEPVDERCPLLARMVIDGTSTLGYSCQDVIDETPGVDPVHGPYDGIVKTRKYTHVSLTRAPGAFPIHIRTEDDDEGGDHG